MKCLNCGLVNFKDAQQCKRCQAMINEQNGVLAISNQPEETKTGNFSIYLFIAIALIAVTIFGGFQFFSVKSQYTNEAKSYEPKEGGVEAELKKRDRSVDRCKVENTPCAPANFPTNTIPYHLSDAAKQDQKARDEYAEKVKIDNDIINNRKPEAYQPPPPGTTYYQNR
jgi:hypothetical protein